MKRFLFIIMITLAAASAQAADVGVSISVDQPGFYGEINIGDFRQPEVIYAQPVYVGPRHHHAEPLYLRVPPHHRKHWKKYCHEYNAYGRPVYFVSDRWYNDVYVPRHHKSRGKEHYNDRYEKHGGKKGHGKDHR